MLHAPGSTWYRFFFYGWLFRDAYSGTLAERSASRRHNKAQARWLPTYMARWAVTGSALFGAAAFVEIGLASPGISALFYVPAVLSVPFEMFTLFCWAWLTFR